MMVTAVSCLFCYDGDCSELLFLLLQWGLQLMGFLDDTCFTVSEACLKVLERLLEVGWGWRLVSRMELLDKIILLSEMNLQPKIQVLAMAVLDQVCRRQFQSSNAGLMGWWLD